MIIYSEITSDHQNFVKVTLINPLSGKLIKWLNTLKQFVGNLPTNYLSVFDHFVGLAPKGLNIVWNSDDVKITNYGRIPWNENWPEDLKFLNSQNLSEVYFIQQIFFYKLVYKYENFSGPQYLSVFSPNAGIYGPGKNSVFGHFSCSDIYV